MENIEVLLFWVAITFGIWLFFSVLGSITRTRPVTRFRTPLGNPEIIDAIAKKAFDKIKRLKPLTESEILEKAELENSIASLEKQLQELDLENKSGGLSKIFHEVRKGEIMDRLWTLQKELNTYSR